MNNVPLNVLSNKNRKDQVTVENLASIINNSGYNRGQRRRLEKALGKTRKLSEKAHKRISDYAYEDYQAGLDSNMRRFFSVLGIVLQEKYGYEESEDKEEISEMFDILNEYLEKYRELTTDEVAEICYEKTGLELIAEK